MLKTIQAGSLRSAHVNQVVTLAGWVDRRRDHGNLIFIDLRDSSGITQIVFDQILDPSVHQSASLLRNEWVIQIIGKVRERPDGTINSELETGQVEVIVSSLNILNESKDKIDVEEKPNLKNKIFKQISKFMNWLDNR